MNRRFTTKDLSVKDLMHYGRDHLFTAFYLFEEKPGFKLDDSYVMTLDSAAYLAHLGIEEILKACWLHEKREFCNEHDITKIIKNISYFSRVFNESKQENWDLILKIESFRKSRYPKENKNFGIEVGTDDSEELKLFLKIILDKMPDELQKIYDAIDLHEGNFIEKCDRILLRKPKDSLN